MAYHEAIFGHHSYLKETFVNVYKDYELGYWFDTREAAIDRVCEKPIYRIHVIPK